ncbi:MAG: DUF1573 domain-containing protein [Verrucomicrobia bacterium]|nr:DUF1573 domain-containing protein [Verrucomicrobiota bacterium]
MIKAFTIVLIAFFSSGAYADTVQWEKKSQSVCVEENMPVSAKFVFTNNSSQNISISSIKTSCGCTIANYNLGEKIPPKGIGTVELKISTTGKSTKFSSTALVIFNKNPIPYVITCEVSINGGLVLKPNVLDWSKNSCKIAKKVTITSTDDKPLLISKISCSNNE